MVTCNHPVQEDMKLPEGKTCGDCIHFERCVMLFGCPKTNDHCDWSPSRFIQIKGVGQ